MKIHRLLLRDWRGVEECEVDFAAPGVTVVAGRNEVGKSSLVEALCMLLEEFDSAKKSKVMAVVPVHKDAGAEVEAEVELGPYRFVYKKRFHRKPRTELCILAPRPENLSGRDAHLRVEALLAEHLDATLWKALQVAQAAGPAQPSLQESAWLRSALDRAAGGASTHDPKAHSLFELTAEERGRWYTDAGKEKRELTGPREELAARRGEVQKLQDRLQRIDEDLQEEQRLAGDERRRQQATTEAQAKAARHAKALARVRALGGEHERAKTAVANATVPLERSRAAVLERERLEEDVAKVRQQLQEVQATLQGQADRRDAARDAEQQARQALQSAERLDAEARAAAKVAADDAEFHRNVLDLAQMQERRARIEASDRLDAKAAAVLHRTKVGDLELQRLEQLNEDLRDAEAALAAAGASVELTAAADCGLRIDGEAVRLSAGEQRVRVSIDPLTVELPGLLLIRVRSGAGVDPPRQRQEAARLALDEALADLGAASLPVARQMHRERTEAQQARTRCAEDRERDLRDLSFEQLHEKLGRLRQEVDGYGAARRAASPLPSDLDAAKAWKQAAEQALAETEQAGRDARILFEQRQLAATSNASSFESAMSTHQTLQLRVEEKQQELAASAHQATTERLREDLRDAQRAYTEADEAERSADAALKVLQPDVVEALAAKSEAKLKSLDEEHRKLREQLLTLRARLEVGDDKGLATELGRAQSLCEQARSCAESIEVQARAASTLYLALLQAREAEERRYVQPYQQRVEALARTVFGPDCRVHVDKDLTILDRTLDSRTVPFDSLSGGAKEQLGVVLRLACAQLASASGGVPVVFDDSFGWSDPDRLDRLGILLEQVGRSCQVVLLTCDPTRARAIQGARLVEL